MKQVQIQIASSYANCAVTKLEFRAPTNQQPRAMQRLESESKSKLNSTKTTNEQIMKMENYATRDFSNASIALFLLFVTSAERHKVK